MGKIHTTKINLDPGEVLNEHVSESTFIDADKMQHCYKAGTGFGFVIGGTPTTREELVFIATKAGTIRAFHGTFNDTGTSMGITYDLKKNGTTMLSSVISFTHADADKVVKDGTLSVTTFVADDHISIAMTVTTSTGCTGPYAWADIEENDAPD